MSVLIQKPIPVRLRPGHIFAIPVDDDRLGCGLVISGSGGVFYMAVFEPLYLRDCMPVLHDIVGQPILFLAESLGAKVSHGYWPVLGHYRVDPSQYPAPVSKITVGSIESYFVVSFDRNRRRPATPEEVRELPFRTT